MHKVEELRNPNSCINKAKDGEMVFVLRAHDPAAPFAVKQWCKKRIQLKKNTANDEQILEALRCARIMHEQQSKGI